MRFVRGLIILPLLFLLFSNHARGQKKPLDKQPRILILLDGSSSMVDKWHNGKSRYKAAEDVILALMDSMYKINKNVEFGLRVFGHQHSVTEKNCYDTKNEVMFGKNNIDQMGLRLEDIKPFGITPIAYAIRKAAEEDMQEEYKNIYSLILITDGGESCGGDICDVVKTLLERKIYFTPYIISLYNSRELEQSYACMGDYMQVLTPLDIPKTVHTIVEGYAPMLRSNTANLKPLQTDEPKPKIVEDPNVVNTSPIEIPVEKPTHKPAERGIDLPVEKPRELPVVNAKPKPERKKEILAAINSINKGPHTRVPIEKPSFTPVSLPQVNISNPLPKESIERLTVVGKPRKLSLLFTVPTYKEVALPQIVWKEIKEEPIPEPKPTAAAPKVKPATKPAIVKSEKPAEITYNVETEDADETTVEVYFTNVKGRFYSTTPLILVKDVVLGNTVHKFYRTVNGHNKPDPQKLPAGKYHFMIDGRANSTAKNVTITANKTNKVIITVSNGSLHFEYKNNPNRPVSEYIARVAQRSGGIDRDQPCDIDLVYEPGSYHVTVNTKPLSHFYIDLDMNSTKTITLNEPGYIQITNITPMNVVSFYAPLGDKYVKFMDLEITGKLDEQQIELKPGPYESRFITGPNTREKVIKFAVESNTTTELELK